jgi:isocitrate dehydrogenase
VPSDVIIDASMPPMIRDGGRMWNAEGELQDCKAVIPDSSYAGIYDAVIATARRTASSIPRRWGACPTSG